MINEFLKKRTTLLSYKSLRENRTSKIVTGQRLALLFDGGIFTRLFDDLTTSDPLSFPDYEEKGRRIRSRSGENDALITAVGLVGGCKVAAAELDRQIFMGSMGSVVGEKLVRLIELAQEEKLPLIVFSASGGARMQEGLYSLMQMAKTSAAIERFRSRGGLFISVLTHPTTGGVSASFASLGDIILAEPGALIGFAGPRVIEQTIGKKLPEGFQRSEFQLAHGFVDKIVKKENMRNVILQLLRLHGFREGETANKKADTSDGSLSLSSAPAALTPYERLSLVRASDRPRIRDYLPLIFDDFIRLHGDRLGGDDPAIIGGIATLNGRPVTVIGHRKGKTIEENMHCNFGMASPEGYRKALRLMKQAEKFGRPVITFIDTPGAYPGMEAEEHGQSAAIAENLAAMSALKVPTISIVTGEGNSGGALAIGVTDEIWMLENAVYAILSPEGFASILWKDASRAPEACELLKMTARDLLDRGFIERIIPEGEGGFQKHMAETSLVLKEALGNKLEDLCSLDKTELLNRRSRKYRHIEGGLSPRSRSKEEVI